MGERDPSSHVFNDKPYLSVNREERFFCVLFAHALLASDSSRKRICEILFQRLDVELDPDALEVFLEVAALRDWLAEREPTRSGSRRLPATPAPPWTNSPKSRPATSTYTPQYNQMKCPALLLRHSERCGRKALRCTTN
jgi:hypothetical protein